MILKGNIIKNKSLLKKLVILVLLVVLSILVLLLLSRFESSQLATNTSKVVDINKLDLESRLEVILSKIENIGDVSVMIVFSEDVIYSERESINVNEKQDSILTFAGIFGEGERANNNNEPVLNRTEITGVVVVAQGVDDLLVMQDVQKAVMTALGINLEKLEVIPMNE